MTETRLRQIETGLAYMTLGLLVFYRGGSLDHGAAEMWTVSLATTLALASLGLALYLVARAERVVQQS